VKVAAPVDLQVAAAVAAAVAVARLGGRLFHTRVLKACRYYLFNYLIIY